MSDLGKDEKSPFTETLVPSGFGGQLKDLPSDKDKIIREVDFGLMDTNDLVGEMSLYKGLVGELNSKYGIKTPKIELVIGRSDQPRDPIFKRKSSVVYAVTDRIKGVNFEDLKIENSEVPLMHEKMETLISNILFYIKDKSSQESDFLGDIYGLYQFMYGRVDGEPEDQFYLVDVDPGFVFHNATKHNIRRFASYLVYLVEDLGEAEKKLGGERLLQARKNINDFFNTIASSDSYFKKLQEVRARMNQGNFDYRDILNEIID